MIWLRSISEPRGLVRSAAARGAGDRGADVSLADHREKERKDSRIDVDESRAAIRK